MESVLDPTIAYQDARYQLLRRIGMGTPYPLEKTAIRTEQAGDEPNTPEHIYSVVPFGKAEKIWIDHPQAGVTYILYDLVSDKEIHRTTSALWKHVSEQIPVFLRTPILKTEQRHFYIRAEDTLRGFSRELITKVSVKAGVNTSLNVAPRQAVVVYDEQLTVQVQQGQSNCKYYLVAGENGVVDKETPLSDEVLLKGVRDFELQSYPLKENTTLRVYALFSSTGLDGILEQDIRVHAKPNTGIVAKPSEEAFVYNTSGAVILEGTQESADYQLFYDWFDDAFDTPTLNVPASKVKSGNGGTIQLEIETPLTEDLVVRVVATNRESKEQVILEQKVRFRVYADTSPEVKPVAQEVDPGKTTIVKVLNTQEGVQYQLRNNVNNKAVGYPQYHSKNKPIGMGAIGLDFSVNPFQQNYVDLVTPALTKDATYNVIAYKPINGLTTQLETLAELKIKVAPDEQ